MSDGMLGKIVKKLVPLPDDVLGIVFDLLSKLDKPEWVESTKQFLRTKPEAVQTAKKLLGHGAVFIVRAIASFSSAVFFDTSGPVGWTGLIFQRMFTGYTETDTPETKLRFHQLKEPASGKQISDELGDNAETTLGQMWEAISANRLKKDGTVYIFHVRSQVDGELWALYCYWGSATRCWRVEANPFSNVWNAGHRVVSP